MADLLVAGRAINGNPHAVLSNATYRARNRLPVPRLSQRLTHSPDSSDRNHNGFSEPGELVSLPQAGITALFTSYREAPIEDEYGNRYKYRGVALMLRNGRGGRAQSVCRCTKLKACDLISSERKRPTPGGTGKPCKKWHASTPRNWAVHYTG